MTLPCLDLLKRVAFAVLVLDFGRMSCADIEILPAVKRVFNRDDVSTKNEC